MWLTTNGILLKRKVDELVSAGLRYISVGFYGVDDAYDAYVQRPERFERVEAGVAYVRKRYGTDINMHLEWLLMRPTCSLESLRATWEFAQRYEMPIYVNLIHYSLPYFVQGNNNELQFRPDDRPAIEAVVEQLLRYKEARPDLLINSVPGLRSIPDWLIKGPAMRVPCTEYQLIWVGPDGTVQMCYVTFGLGNLHDRRLSDMLFTDQHQQAAKDAFALNCPNCHCCYDKRVLRHGPTRWRYS
jgi:cyclic pyranopterin phosphate synthase